MRTRLALIAIAVIGVVGPPVPASSAAAAAKDKARSKLVRVLERTGIITDIQFDDTPGNRMLRYRMLVGSEGQKADQLDVISLVTLTSVRPVFKNGSYGLQVVFYNSTRSEPDPFWWLSSRVSKSDVEEAANALRLIGIEAQREADELDAAEFERFRPQARGWREAPAKPEIPETVRRRNVIAENAIKEKDFAKASQEYQAALKEFPCWPQGQFNLAYISGETKAYRTALLHMKSYLELTPDAPDAQAARDKMIIWQDKIRSNLENEMAESSAGSGSRKR